MNDYYEKEYFLEEESHTSKLREATANLKNKSNTGKLPVGKFNPFIESSIKKEPELIINDSNNK